MRPFFHLALLFIASLAYIITWLVGLLNYIPWADSMCQHYQYSIPVDPLPFAVFVVEGILLVIGGYILLIAVSFFFISIIGIVRLIRRPEI